MTSENPAPLSDAELEQVLKSGVFKVTINCPTCAGTGWDTSIFLRNCRECGATWDDMDGSRAGSEAMEAWAQDPHAQETQPCGHPWKYHIEHDRVVCAECDGEGIQVKRVPMVQLVSAITKNMVDGMIKLEEIKAMTVRLRTQDRFL